MSHQLDLAKPGGALRRDESAAVFGSAALPFGGAPISFECDHGLSLAQIVDELIAQGQLDEAWRDHLAIYLDDIECPRDMWARVRPRPGRIVAIRARPGLEAVFAFLVDLAINIAVAVAVNTLISAFVGGAPEQPSFEQIKEIESSRNEVARFRKLNAVFGKFRVFPIHAAKPYTEGADEKVNLYMLLCWGLAPVALETGSLKIGDTPITDFEGVTVQHKLTQAAAMPTLFPSRVDEEPGYGVMLFADGWQQRTTTADDAEELQVEIVFTQGLIFYSGDGGIKPFGVSLRIRYREEGSSTWLDFETGAAAPEGHDYVLSGYKKRKPFRMTFKRNVAPGKYEVAVKRDQADDPGPKGYNEFAWTKLRAFAKQPPVLDNDLALTAIKIEAGDQLNGVVDLVNGVVTRIAPKWDDVEEEFGAEGETQNPAEIVRWIACGPGAAQPRDPETEIDNEAFGAWAELCEARGWKCDYELRAGGGQDEVMEAVARCGRGSLVERSGKLSVIIDDVQPAPSQKFTPRNSWGFRAQRRYPRETHALRLQFNNEEKNYVPDEMFVYYPGYDANTAELIVTVPTLGKTSPLEVYQSGLRIIAEDLLRPEDYAWRTDIENLAVKRGQRIAIAHPVIAVGRRSAKVTARTLNGGGTHVTALTLDEAVVQTPGDTYGLKWRKHAAGVISVEDSLALTNMGTGEGKVVTLAAVGGVPLASAPAVGDLVTFGDFGIETLDCVVQSVSRVSDFEGEVTAVPYTAELWDGDDAELPEWSSNVSGDAFPRPPAPEVLGVRSDSTGIFVAYDFPFALADRVEQVEAYWRQDIDADAAFELVSVIPSSTRVAAYPPGEGGVNYKLKLVSVGRAGQRTIRTPSEEISVVSAGSNVGLSGFLTNQSHTVATNAAGTGGDFSDAGGAFKLYRGDIDISDGTDPDFDTAYELVSADAGLSISIHADTGVYTITALTVDHATATLRASSYGQSIDLVYSIAKSRAGVDGGDGDDGADAQTIRLTATAQQFTFDPENNANPAAQSITLTVNRQNVPSGTVSWSSSPAVTLTGTGDSRALSVANFGANTAVEITATLGSLTDKITIVRLRSGGNLFTTVRSSNVSLTGRALKKESGSGAWDSQAYSQESYVGGAFCSARPNATNAAMAFGLNTDPTTNADRSSIDYAWDLDASGKARIYENGVLAWDNSGAPESYTSASVPSIVYDGVSVRYYLSGVLKRTVVPDTAQLRLYFDSSFFTVGGQLNDVAFGPSGAGVTRQEKRYTRSKGPPATPTGDNPAGWELTPAGGDEALYSSLGLKTSADELIGVWSPPVLETPNKTRAFNAVDVFFREDHATFNGGTYRARVHSIAHCLNMLVTDETPGPQLRSPSGLSIAGATYTKVRAHVRFLNATPPTWEGKCYYVTGGHSFSESYMKQIAQPADYRREQWMLLEWDMAALTAGGSDWTSNTITQLRLDFCSTAFCEWEIDYVEVVSAAGVVGQRWDFTSSAESWTGVQVSALTHSGSRAPSGTAEENTWWAVVAAPGGEGEPGDPPSGFSATIDLASVPSGTANLRTIANAAGYTGLSDATITFEVESGINITGNNGGGIAIDSGTWPTSSYAIALTLTIKSGGIVRGGGGDGGDGRTTGPGGKLGGPGGGGGQPNGRGGAGGMGWETEGSPGEDATTTAPGDPNGGAYGVAGGSVLICDPGSAGGDAVYCRVPMTVNINSGAEVKGGGGGGGNPGGAAGYCVRKNGNAVTVNNSGTTAGAIG